MRAHRPILVVVALIALALIIPAPEPERLVYFNGTAVSVQP